MRSQARQFIIKRRTDMHEPMHGEVHGSLEPSQHDLHSEDKQGGLQLNALHIREEEDSITPTRVSTSPLVADPERAGFFLSWTRSHTTRGWQHQTV